MVFEALFRALARRITPIVRERLAAELNQAVDRHLAARVDAVLAGKTAAAPVPPTEPATPAAPPAALDPQQQVFALLTARLDEPLVLVDVGARWGALDSWNRFGEKARIYCFEADPEEAKRLNDENPHAYIEYVGAALSDGRETVDLTITAGVGCSSVYSPVRALYEKYPGCGMMRPARTVSCPATSLDAFMAERGIGRIHGMKLDTQGSELDVLRGAEKALERCEFLLVEVEFNPLYENQPLFCDVDRFLRDRGFCLWRINNLAHYSTGILNGTPHGVLMSVDPGGFQHVPLENGQLFWGDAFYVRARSAPTGDEPLDLQDAVAGAALALQYGFWDLVVEMIRRTGDTELQREVSTLIHSGEPLATLPFQIAYLRSELEKSRELVRRLSQGSVGAALQV